MNDATNQELIDSYNLMRGAIEYGCCKPGDSDRMLGIQNTLKDRGIEVIYSKRGRMDLPFDISKAVDEIFDNAKPGEIKNNGMNGVVLLVMVATCVLLRV